jgi:hypothetical protein
MPDVVTYLYVGSHVDYLASGQPLTHGAVVDASDLSDADRRLFDAGVLVGYVKPSQPNRRPAPPIPIAGDDFSR